MPVTAQATASGRVFYTNFSIPATKTTAYTAPAQSANVTAPSATAYIKEIVVTNYNAATQWISLWVGGTAILPSVPIAPNDCKILSGLNTMIPASGLIELQAQTASTMSIHISGVEIQ